MIFEEKTITLKDGRCAVLKTPEMSDAEGMLAHIVKASGETDFLARYPEDWEGTSIESEEKWIKGLRESKSTLGIAVYVDGQIVGNCSLQCHRLMKTAHRATVGIAILKDFWGLGIGSAMFRELIAAAEDLGIRILELDLVEGNDRALGLYKKFGFETVGQKKKAFRLKDGRYFGEIIMQKFL